MLAQSFKAPTELGIGEAAFNALVTVLGMLDRGEIPAEEFSMEYWWDRTRDHRGRFCGTVGCLGGWAGYVARKAGLPDDDYDVLPFDLGGNALGDLFHPIYFEAWLATREQAAQALRNYLTTGKADWQGVMDG